MKLVSVIIPCYNDAETLSRAIESVIRQTYSAIEIIVVNDCSLKTQLIEICLAKYPQVRYVKNSFNVGLAATRNNGLVIANGELIAFLDADDEYHPDKIARQVMALDDAEVITCGLVNLYPNGQVVKNIRSIRTFKSVGRLIYRNTLNGAGLLAPKRLLLEHGGYDVTLRSCEDYDLWLRLLSAGIKVKDIGEPLYLYHFNLSGLSKNIINISKWELEVIKRHAARMGLRWSKSYHYASAVLVRLLCHLLRGETAKNEELRRQTILNISLLEGFPLIQIFCRLVAKSRLMSIPAYFLGLLNRFTGQVAKN